jgi:Rod binding domain-containing protein
MIEGIDGLQATPGYGKITQSINQNPQKVKEEFLAIFYKEILKQAFSGPDLSLNGEEDSSANKIFTKDLLVEKLAQELAQRGAFSANDLFPAAAVEGTIIR